jgi:type I restriction enzyme M protein
MSNFACSSWLKLFEQCTKPRSPQTTALPTVAIANPPFGKAKVAYSDLQHFELGHSWKQTNGTFTRTDRIKSATETEALFTELSIRCLQANEIVVLLVPNGLLNAPGLLYARRWIMNQTQIVASIQLPQEVWKVECKLGITTSLLVLKRKTVGEADTDYQIFMAMCNRCGYDSRGKTKPQSESDLPQIVTAFQSFLSKHNLSDHLNQPNGSSEPNWGGVNNNNIVAQGGCDVEIQPN